MEERRPRFRRNLNALYLPMYDALCEKLPDEWQPHSGIRSFMAQDRLYAQGRTSPGNKVTKARGGDSPHNYGCASDWARFTADGEPLWSDQNDPSWQIYLDAILAVGLRSGIEFDDVMHNELRIAVTWTTIAAIWRDKGPEAANMSIMAAMVSIEKREEDDDMVI